MAAFLLGAASEAQYRIWVLQGYRCAIMTLNNQPKKAEEGGRKFSHLSSASGSDFPSNMSAADYFLEGYGIPLWSKPAPFPDNAKAEVHDPLGRSQLPSSLYH